MRSANHGWRVLHTCGSSSRSTAAGWSSTSAIAWIVFFTSIDQLAWRRGGAGGHLLRGGEQLVVVDAAVHEPDPLGLGAVHHLAEHDRGERGLRAGDAAQHPRVAAARVDADLQEAGVELRPPRREPHVAAEREVHAGADGGAVHRGERRQRAAGDPQEPLVDRAEALLGRLGEVAEVRAGAERRRGAGDDDRADDVVGLDLVHRGDDLGDHRRGQRVALGRVVEGERGDAPTVGTR